MPIINATVNSLVFSILIALVIFFFWISIYYRDKYNKTSDELLDLADKSGFFTKKSSLMRYEERQFFDVLMKLYQDQYFIFPQVRLAAILDIKNNLKDHDNLYRHIDHLSLDYVIFDKGTLTPLVAIELNGKSHFQFNRQNRDTKVKSVLKNAGIGFLPVDVAPTYNEFTIKTQIDILLT